MTVSARLSGVCVVVVAAACISIQLTTCRWLVTNVLRCYTVRTPCLGSSLWMPTVLVVRVKVLNIKHLLARGSLFKLYSQSVH